MNDAAHRNMADLSLGSRREFGGEIGKNESMHSLVKSRYRSLWEGDIHSEPDLRIYLLRSDSSFEMILAMCLDPTPLSMS